MEEQARDYKLQGTALMGATKYKDAQKMFLKALQFEENVDLLIDLGNAYASNGDYADAITTFTKALSYEPDNGELLFDIGSVYLLQERLKKCLEYYNKAEAAGFDNVRLYINFAAIYSALGDQQMELRNYTKAIDKNPLVGDLYVKKALLLLEMGKATVALDVLDDMRKVFPDAFEGYDLAARCYLVLGNVDHAISILDQGIIKFPNDINLKLSKVRILTEQGKIDDAKKLLDDVKSSKNAEIYRREILMNEVTIESSLNNPLRMKELLLEVLTLEGDRCDEAARFMLMMTCNLLQEYDLALEQASRLENEESNTEFYISGLYYKGEFLQKVGKNKESEIHFRKAIKKLRKLSMSNRTFYEVYIYRALAHKNLKEYDKAIEMGEFIIDLQPERADGYMILADIYKDQGEEENSEKYFKMAQEKNPN